MGRKGVRAHLIGGVAEWLKAAVLKTVERLRVPGVRIPPPPPLICYYTLFLISFFVDNDLRPHP